MSFAEIQQEALTLSEQERAALAATLLDTLPAPGADLSDEEAEQRDRDLETGRVEAISQEEFVRRVKKERR
ncbi:MAG: addiction module protein [Verrucomicrobiota bacterium]